MLKRVPALVALGLVIGLLPTPTVSHADAKCARPSVSFAECAVSATTDGTTKSKSPRASGKTPNRSKGGSGSASGSRGSTGQSRAEARARYQQVGRSFAAALGLMRPVLVGAGREADLVRMAMQFPFPHTGSGGGPASPNAPSGGGGVVPGMGRQVAQELLAQVDLKAPRMGVYPLPSHLGPEAMGYVGWNTWLWVERPDEQTWGPVTRSQSVGGASVSITAKVKHVVWDMGDGNTLTCGRGVAWPSHATTNQKSPECNYVYERDGYYTITATAYWEVSWSGLGESGVIPVELSSSVPYTVAEAQVVLVSGKDKDR